MNSFRIKKRYSHFKAWQRHPFCYKIKNTETQHCQNCAQEFVGNHCPCCGQRAGDGPISWQSIWQECLNVWGMGGRSMPYSIWQLLWRPGYFISDYINGRRQVSFPPVKMLFIIGVFLLIIDHYLIPSEATVVPTSSEGLLEPLFDFINWMREHRDWGALALAMIQILPTWIIYRNAPRNAHSSMPQCFFIQVFICMASLLFSILEKGMPFVANYLHVFWILAAYKQLFGYGWWGTFWRTALVYFNTIILGVGLAAIYDLVRGLFGIEVEITDNVAVVFLCLFILYYGLGFTLFINCRAWKKRKWWQTALRLLGAIIIPIILLVIVDRLTYGDFLDDEETEQIEEQKQTDKVPTACHSVTFEAHDTAWHSF